MKIELKEPYKSIWKWGYLVINSEPRRNVILYNSHSDRSTVSYARYLYETNIGKFIDKELVVDHIDDNQMNDVLENFQLLTVEENNLKRYRNHKPNRKMVRLKCGGCGEIFEKDYYKTHLRKNSIAKSTYCGISCARKCSGKKQLFSEVIEIFFG